MQPKQSNIGKDMLAWNYMELKMGKFHGVCQGLSMYTGEVKERMKLQRAYPDKICDRQPSRDKRGERVLA
jgi:hypothetical protein